MSKLPAPDGRTQVAPGSKNLLHCVGRNPKAKNRRNHKDYLYLCGFGVDTCSDQSWPQCDADNLVNTHSSSFTRLSPYHRAFDLDLRHIGTDIIRNTKDLI